MGAHVSVSPDPAIVRRFVEIIHAQAARALEGAPQPGYLQLSRLWPGDGKFTVSGRFRIGDVDGMAAQVRIDSEAGFNVYVEPRTVPETLARIPQMDWLPGGLS